MGNCLSDPSPPTAPRYPPQGAYAPAPVPMAAYHQPSPGGQYPSHQPGALPQAQPAAAHTPYQKTDDTLPTIGSVFKADKQSGEILVISYDLGTTNCE